MKAKRTIGISEFKAKALSLVSEVEESGQELILTRRGVPVAKLIPFAKQGMQSLGSSLKGKAKILGSLELPKEIWGKFSS